MSAVALRSVPARPAGLARASSLLPTALVLLMMSACGGGGRTGSAFKPTERPRAEAQSLEAAYLRAAFDEATDRYLLGEFARARDSFRRLALGCTGSREAAWAWYWAGRCELALGHLARACSSFDKALAASDRHAGRAADLRAYVLAGLADAALAGGNPAGALDHLARVEAEGLIGRLAADEALFRRASALEALGKTGAAARAFERLERLWPDSFLAAEAAARRGRLGPQSVAAREPVGYEVTAGVFWARQSAEAAAARLRARGFAARVEAVAAPRPRPVRAGHGVGEKRFAVSLGLFADRADAERLARGAARKGFPARVLP